MEMSPLAGMRPIVNLGKSSRITFKTAFSRHCHSLPVQRTVLSFRPVNWHLQHLHRVSVAGSLPACQSRQVSYLSRNSILLHSS